MEEAHRLEDRAINRPAATSQPRAHSLQQLVEQLLYEDEGNALDFKTRQYPFGGATDDQRGELIKDILAMANSWSRADARYILIGVKDVVGGRSEVLGVDEHLPEHALQQLVSSRTNRPVELSYHAVEIDGKSVGVLAIPWQQRPSFLRKTYGALAPNTVYVRRGSSTMIADPDEIAKMGASGVTTEPVRSAKLEVELFRPETREICKKDFSVTVEVLRIPDPRELPSFERRYGLNSLVPLTNSNFYRDLARYLWALKATLQLGFRIRNVGDAVAENVVLRVEVPPDSGYVVLPEAVEAPDEDSIIAAPLIDRIEQNANPYRPKLREGAIVELRYDLGAVQPGLPVWTDPFFVVVQKPGPLVIPLEVYSDGLPKPQFVDFPIEASGEVFEIDSGAIVDIGNKMTRG